MLPYRDSRAAFAFSVTALDRAGFKPAEMAVQTPSRCELSKAPLPLPARVSPRRRSKRPSLQAVTHSAILSRVREPLRPQQRPDQTGGRPRSSPFFIPLSRRVLMLTSSRRRVSWKPAGRESNPVARHRAATSSAQPPSSVFLSGDRLRRRLGHLVRHFVEQFGSDDLDAERCPDAQTDLVSVDPHDCDLDVAIDDKPLPG